MNPRLTRALQLIVVGALVLAIVVRCAWAGWVMGR